jgi:hypothetical protein
VVLVDQIDASFVTALLADHGHQHRDNLARTEQSVPVEAGGEEVEEVLRVCVDRICPGPPVCSPDRRPA